MMRKLTLIMTAAIAVSASLMAAPASARAACVRTAADGECGPYHYPRITGSNGFNTYVDNNVWNPVPGWHQKLVSHGPGNFSIIARMPAGNTAVVSYGGVSQLASDPRDSSRALRLSGYAKIQSSYTETMHATRKTNGEAAYDIWLNNWKDEVMIQVDNRGSQRPGPGCPFTAHVTFGGWKGVPKARWGFCDLDGELIWQIPHGHVTRGSVGILAMLRWLAAHRYLKAGSTLTAIGFGWEICSTGGRSETFHVSRYSIREEFRKGI